MKIFLVIAFCWCAGYFFYMAFFVKRYPKEKITDNFKKLDFGLPISLSEKGSKMAYYALHTIVFFVYPYMVFTLVNKHNHILFKRINGFFIRKKANYIFNQYLGSGGTKSQYALDCIVFYFLKRDNLKISYFLIDKTLMFMNQSALDQRDELMKSYNLATIEQAREMLNTNETFKNQCEEVLRRTNDVDFFLKTYKDFSKDHEVFNEFDLQKMIDQRIDKINENRNERN